MGADIAPTPCRYCTDPMQILHWSAPRPATVIFSYFFGANNCTIQNKALSLRCS